MVEQDEKNNRITIEDCNIMSWKDFEVHVGKLYEKMGYKVKKTSGGGDHGCDLVLLKNGRKTAVDAKHWKSDMHSKVVGQVLRAISYYDANDGIIIGISHFTKWAIEEAKKTQIELVDRDRLEKLLYEYPITRVKNSQLISDISAENIYRKYPDFDAIIQKMVLKVLKYRDDDYVSASFLIQEIKNKLILELIPSDDERMCLEKTLGLLKDRYSIDLNEEKREEEKLRTRELERLENLRLENLRLETESEKQRQLQQDTLSKQREMRRIRDGMMSHDAAEKEPLKNVEPITISPEETKIVVAMLAEVKHIEISQHGGLKYPIEVSLLFDNLMGKNIPVEKLGDILKKLIRNGQIHESKPGYCNSA